MNLTQINFVDSDNGAITGSFKDDLSLESLLIRGYDVAALILIETLPFRNLSAIREHASRQLKLRSGSGRALFNWIEQENRSRDKGSRLVSCILYVLCHNAL